MKNNRYRYRVLSFFIFALGGAVLALIAYASSSKTEEEAPPSATPLKVRVVVAEPSTHYTLQQEYVGQVEARRISDVGFELGGKVVSIVPEEGDALQEGDVLAQLDIELLQSQKRELQAQKKQAEAELELARLTKERMQKSVQAQAVTEQAFDEAKQNFLARRAAVETLEASIDKIDVQIRKSRLLAPFDAVVNRRLVDEGRVVETGSPILQLLETTPNEVRIGITPELISSLQDRSSILLSIRGNEYPAHYKSVLPQQSTSTRTVEVIFQLHEVYDSVRPGDLAVLTLVKEIDEPGFWLPLQALTESSRGLWSCYVVVEHNDQFLIQRRELTLIHQTGSQAYVSGSLQAGERVVREGIHRLVPNQPVRIQS